MGKRLHKSLRDSGFYLTPRNPPTAQLEHISEYLDCLLEFGKLDFPLDRLYGLPHSLKSFLILSIYLQFSFFSLYLNSILILNTIF